MKKRLALQTILWTSILGLLFSGYLSVSELFLQSCPLGTCSKLANVPVCVFGFIMYLVISVIALIGILEKDEKQAVKKKKKK